MRILHLTDHYPPALGGIEAHVEALARRQAARGDEVSVLTSSSADADGWRAEDPGPVTVRRVRSAAEGRAVDLSGYDIVHAHHSVLAPFTAPLAAGAARRGAATLVTVHSLWTGLGPVPAVAAALAGLRSAPVLWSAVSRLAADQVAACLPRTTEVVVLPNAVDVGPRRHTPAPDDDGAVHLVSTMRIARRKRPIPLLAMTASLARQVDVPVTLTVIGDGPLRRRLERAVSPAGLGGRVRLTGRVSPGEVAALLTEADLYVAPAVLESFGLAALEARSVGLPVVGRSDSGMTDFVRSGVEGLLASTDQGVVACLRQLVLDGSLRRRISEHNRNVPPAMTWSNTLRAHDAAYARLLGHASPALPPAPRRAHRPWPLPTVRAS
jgi:glycosyltransferase involved in cell wall biosynthesis